MVSLTPWRQTSAKRADTSPVVNPFVKDNTISVDTSKAALAFLDDLRFKRGIDVLGYLNLDRAYLSEHRLDPRRY